MTPQEVRVGDRLEDINGQIGTVKEIGTDAWLMEDGFYLAFVALQHGARVMLRSAYEAPKLTRMTVETATGRELDVLAEALYGLRRRPEGPSTGWAETDLELRARCVQSMRQLRVMPGADLVPKRILLGIGADPDPVPAGPYDDLFIKPTSPADLERKFGASPVKAAPPSFHVGIDLGGEDTIALTLVQDGKILSYAHVDVMAEMVALGEAFRPYDRVMEIIDREIRKLAGIFCAPIHILPRLPCVGDCGETTEQRPGEITWMCHGCSTKPRPETLAPVQAQTPVTDNAVPCCRIGGAKGLDGLPCPLHPPAREPFVPEHDTFGFLKP